MGQPRDRGGEEGLQARLVPTFLLRLRGEIFSVSEPGITGDLTVRPLQVCPGLCAQYVVLVFTSDEWEKEGICAHGGEGLAGPCENISERSWLNVDVCLGLDLGGARGFSPGVDTCLVGPCTWSTSRSTWCSGFVSTG
ncbi:hypothetical protein HJG60_009499 [Phyllostomus discolor]|uniref:Uncharacterized protein n=1 Tax=Phyllostomus discolor TaxID=89673 RepID=A0A834DCU3_9CHIR|nr:hypothetical protein HJG60_009499 [Phyllostomus discolor]